MTESDFIPCMVYDLPDADRIEAAADAIRINPANAPAQAEMLPFPTAEEDEAMPVAYRLALQTSKYWGAGGVRLTVGFLDNPPADLRNRLLQHMNAWNQSANVTFVASQTDPQVRIARTPGQGYYSYLGTDILHISRNQPTMNLDSFTMATPESEFHRVVRHETGHTLGFPHEHLRKQLVQRLDPNKTITYFMQTQGWSASMVRQQVLTPLEDSGLTATSDADQLSIMCYQLPGSITVDGKPIIGGSDIDPLDYEFAAKLYPKAMPPSPPPPPIGGTRLVVDFNGIVPTIKAARLE